ncbi:hypothetical protein HanXRQr2_Chr12g0532791 [Helianthus annuus]|uniref:Uncharacterized protein n=1 Tax=Helianthus annuus TaxID=4232 RepID=A0A9K3HF55_HELAN|nr:hypothetical protein HanXRQr2_Chr12g0532791 [Helianthus annuus]
MCSFYYFFFLGYIVVSFCCHIGTKLLTPFICTIIIIFVNGRSYHLVEISSLPISPCGHKICLYTTHAYASSLSPHVPLYIHRLTSSKHSHLRLRVPRV